MSSEKNVTVAFSTGPVYALRKMTTTGKMAMRMLLAPKTVVVVVSANSTVRFIW